MTDSILEEMEQALADKEALREERGIGEQPRGMRLSQKTNIAFGDEEMPGRTRAWRTDDGREVWLNTGELPHHLNKRRPDGKRIFVLKKPLEVAGTETYKTVSGAARTVTVLVPLDTATIEKALRDKP